jgi:peptidoglycan/LPS O-acetylase OafA/YrhL
MTVLTILGWGLMGLILLFRGLASELHLEQTGLNVTVLSLGTALVLVYIQKRTESGRQITWKWPGLFRFFGKNSYDTYLTHMFVVYVMFEIYKRYQFSGEWTWTLYITTILLSGLLDEMVARYISNPASSYLREQFKDKRISR